MIDFKTISLIDGHLSQIAGLQGAIWILTQEHNAFADQQMREAHSSLLVALEQEIKTANKACSLLHHKFYQQENILEKIGSKLIQ